MTQADDPFEKMVRLWAEGARSFSDAFEGWLDNLPRPGQAGDGSFSADGIASVGREWSRAVTRLSSLQSEMIQRLLEDLPEATRERLDRQTFSQLGRLADARWKDDLDRFVKLGQELSGRTDQADPERLDGLMHSMVSEYLSDLRGLGDDAFRLDLAPLAAAWKNVLTGEADERSRKMVDRFLEALRVKAQYGSEYYADPQRTPVGQTPREVVYRQGRLSLYRYHLPDGPDPCGPPVLLVYSVINKPYILDLVPGFSFIEHLLQQGLDVYLIDWGETRPGDRETRLDDYIDPGIAGCVDAIRDRTGSKQVALFGHCIGGNLALLYAALYPDRVSRLVTLTTPITAAEGGVVALWTDRDVFPVDAIVDAYGHMPAKLIRYTFMVIKPYYEVLKWKMFLDNLGDDRVMDLFYPVDRWANENVDIPGEVFRKFIVEVFHEERFARGETEIHGRRADLGAIECPLLNLAATRDWIVPLESARVLNDLVGSRTKRFIPMEGAHVSVVIDPRARPHWTQMSDFLSRRGDSAGLAGSKKVYRKPAIRSRG